MLCGLQVAARCAIGRENPIEGTNWHPNGSNGCLFEVGSSPLLLSINEYKTPVLLADDYYEFEQLGDSMKLPIICQDCLLQNQTTEIRQKIDEFHRMGLYFFENTGLSDTT